MKKWHMQLGKATRFEAVSVGSDEGQVAIIPLDESSEENARLIAAAPEMLEALKVMVVRFSENNDLEKSARTQAIIAIDKAEGN